MKENSIEEKIKIALDKFLDNKDKDSAILIVEKFILGNYILRGGRTNIVKDSLRYILSDYKRVLKENEELKEDRKNNNEMIAFAQNEMLNYMSGYEDGKKHKMTAVAQVVENQRYYIVREQMEKYKERIKRLQKENEELKIQEATQRKINELLVQRYSNSISLQKIKDKIEEYKNMLKTCNKAKDIDRIKAINERILELQELIEEEK